MTVRERRLMRAITRISVACDETEANMTDRERRLMRALTRISVACDVLETAAFELPPDCETLCRLVERNGRSLAWAAEKIHRELDKEEA